MAVPGGVNRGVGGHKTRPFAVRGAQVFCGTSLFDVHTSTHIRAVYGLAGLDGNCLGCRRLWRCRIPASCALTPCFGPSLPSLHRHTHTQAGVSHSVTCGTQLIVFVGRDTSRACIAAMELAVPSLPPSVAAACSGSGSEVKVAGFTAAFRPPPHMMQVPVVVVAAVVPGRGVHKGVGVVVAATPCGAKARHWGLVGLCCQRCRHGGWPFLQFAMGLPASHRAQAALCSISRLSSLSLSSSYKPCRVPPLLLVMFECCLVRPGC